MQRQGTGFQKTIIVLVSLIFTGGLLVYTGNANLDLLSRVYPNPNFVGFGMLSLEGGVIYWAGYYLLHWAGNHKGVAVVMVVLDFLLSMVGFFMDINLGAGGAVKTDLFPPTIIVLSADIAVNVGMGILVHFLPTGESPEQQQYTQIRVVDEDRGDKIPSPLAETPTLLVGAATRQVQKLNQKLKQSGQPKIQPISLAQTGQTDPIQVVQAEKAPI
jgi:hypothetical protein